MRSVLLATMPSDVSFFLPRPIFCMSICTASEKVGDVFQVTLILEKWGYSPNSQMHILNSLQLMIFSCSLSFTILALFIYLRLLTYCRKEKFHKKQKQN